MSGERHRVIDALQVLSSKDAQYDLLCRAESDPDRKTPLNLASKLWTSWIQDIYLPNRSTFTSAFRNEALEALDAFTQFFRARIPLFQARFESLMIDTHWLSVIEYANVLLEQLARDDTSSVKDG
jgi:hypothetical protein